MGGSSSHSCPQKLLTTSCNYMVLWPEYERNYDLALHGHHQVKMAISLLWRSQGRWVEPFKPHGVTIMFSMFRFVLNSEPLNHWTSPYISTMKNPIFSMLNIAYPNIWNNTTEPPRLWVVQRQLWHELVCTKGTPTLFQVFYHSKQPVGNPSDRKSET